MIYLAEQYIWFLAAAFVIGITVGWTTSGPSGGSGSDSSGERK